MTSSTAARPARTGLPIAILALAGFAVVTTEFLIIGLLPSLARDLGITVEQGGLLVTLFAFTVMIAGPILTAQLDHIDRKRLFVVILLIFVASNLLAAIAPNVWILAIARFVPALALPVFWGTSSDTAAKIAGPEHAGRSIARVYLGISAAMVLGVPLGTIAATYVGWRGAFVLLATLCLLMALLIHLFMPAMPGTPRPPKGTSNYALLRQGRFLLHTGLSIVAFTAMFTAYTYLAETLESVAGIDTAHVGWWLMGFGLLGLLGNWIGGRIVDRTPLGSTILFTALLALGMAAVTPLAPVTAGLVIALAVWGMAHTGLFPISQIRVMKQAGPEQALAASVNVSAANAGVGLGAILGGLVIDTWGIANLGYASAALAAAATIYAVALAATTDRDRRTAPAAE